MKLILSPILILVALLVCADPLSIALAQTVTRVTGADASFDAKAGASFSVGDEVHFLKENLDSAGQGKVVKVSPGGQHAIAKITSGKIEPGMTVEKIGSPSSSDEKSSAKEKKNDPYDSLTPDEKAILARGEIGTNAYVIGGILGTYPLGFGIGHAIQGRYSEMGYIFTLAEVGALAVTVVGLSECSNSWGNTGCGGGTIVLGLVAYAGFRIWEIVDLWVTPPQINDRYRQLQQKIYWKQNARFTPAIIPLRDGGMLALRMTF